MNAADPARVFDMEQTPPPVVLAAREDPQADDARRLARALGGGVRPLAGTDAPNAREGTDASAPPAPHLYTEAALRLVPPEGLRPDAPGAPALAWLAPGDPLRRYGLAALGSLLERLRACRRVLTTDPRDHAWLASAGIDRPAWLGAPAGADLAERAEDPDRTRVRIAVLAEGTAAEPETLLPLLWAARAVPHAEVAVAGREGEAAEALARAGWIDAARLRVSPKTHAALAGAEVALVAPAVTRFGHDVAHALAAGASVVTVEGRTTLGCFLGTDAPGPAAGDALRDALMEHALRPAVRAARRERARIVLADRFSADALRSRLADALRTARPARS